MKVSNLSKILIFVMLILTIGMTNVFSALSDGLVSYHSFDTDLTDDTGNSITFSESGTTALVTGSRGIFNI